MLDTLTKLRDPYGNRTILATVIDGIGELLHDETKKAAELARCWRQIFQPRPVATALSRAVTESRAHQLAYGPIPSASTFYGALRHAKRAAAGPDGLPAAAWAAAGPAAGRTLQRLFIYLIFAVRTPASLNAGAMVFLPKPTGSPNPNAEWHAARSARTAPPRRSPPQSQCVPNPACRSGQTQPSAASPPADRP